MAELSTEYLLAEIEAGLGQAARRAWRELQPAWREIEAEVALAAAVAAVHRRRPDLSPQGTLDELKRLGMLVIGSAGQVGVRVPPLPYPQPPSGGLQ